MEGFDTTTKTALNGPFICPECDEEYYNAFRLLNSCIDYRNIHRCPDKEAETLLDK